MEVKTMLAPKGSNCRPANSMSPKYITIHETGNKSPTAGALNHANYLCGGGKNYFVSWHYAVDDKIISQSIPDNENAWHAGDGENGTGNRESLAIEICVNSNSDFKKAIDNAILLVADLMKKHKIPLENVVQHNHWKGKNCPENIRKGNPITWQQFRDRVEKTLKEKEQPTLYTVQVGAFAVKENAIKYAENLRDEGYQAFVKEKGD